MILLAKLDRLVGRIVAALDDEQTPFSFALLTFFFAVMLRTAVEMFSDQSLMSLARVAHYSLFYASLAVSLTIALHLLTRTPVPQVARAVLPSFVVLLVAPVWDLVITGGTGINMGYISPDKHNAWYVYFTFLGGFNEKGATTGMRLEIACVLIGTAWYLRHKAVGWLKGLFAIPLVYTIIFAHGCQPYVVKLVFEPFGVPYTLGDALAVPFYLVWLFIIGTALAYLGSPRYFWLFVRDLRWLRVGHYLVMFALGVAFTIRERGFSGDATVVLDLALVPVALLLAILYCIVTNNLADIRIDEISNADRPLFRPGVDPLTYSKAGWPFLALALAYGAAAGFEAFFVIGLFLATYFLYSMPPLRLKRVPVLSKTVIGANSLALMVLGYIMAGGTLLHFPRTIFYFLLFGFSFAVNFIDLKDYEGDKAEGIKTLPVLIGLRPAKIVLGLSFIGLYCLTWPILDITAWVPLDRRWYFVLLVGLGLVQVAIVNRKRYSETPVFGLYLINVLGLLGYVMFLAPEGFLDAAR